MKDERSDTKNPLVRSALSVRHGMFRLVRARLGASGNHGGHVAYRSDFAHCRTHVTRRPVRMAKVKKKPR